MLSKKKRVRTSFKHQQLRIMKAHFQINQNPDSKDLKELSERTGLQKRVLQVWFQNSRAKQRKSSGPCSLSMNNLGSISTGLINGSQSANMVSADSSINLDDDDLFSEEDDGDEEGDEENEENITGDNDDVSDEEEKSTLKSKLPGHFQSSHAHLNTFDQGQQAQQQPQIRSNSLIDFYCY